MVPDLIEYVNNNKDKVGLYYYHYPLIQLHPAALTLSKVMIVASKDGIKDIESTIYKEDLSKYFDSKEKDEKKILDGFNKLFKTDISLDQVQKPTINEELLKDKTMGNAVLVGSTPTIYINGKKDKTQIKYKTLGK